MAREYFQCYHSYLQQMKGLSDAEFGRLIREALKYSSTGQSDPLPGKEEVAFPFVAFNIDREKQAYEEKCEKLRENGSKKQMVANGSNCPQMVANGSNCREDKEKDKEEDKEKEYILPTGEVDAHTREAAPFNEIVNLYHSICKTFPKVMSLSEKRKSAIRARLNTYTVEQFKEMFKKAESSSFLKGANDRDWIATFDWLIADSNFAKVLDGNYDDKTVKTGSDKSHKTRFVPNPTRDTTRDFETSMAIIEAEMKGVNL